MDSEDKTMVMMLITVAFVTCFCLMLVGYKIYADNQCKIAAFGNPAINSVEMLKEVCK